MSADRALLGDLSGRRGTAITEAGTDTDYGTLLDDARRLAGQLRRLGARPGAVVPIQGVPTRSTVTQVVAVLLTGAGYAPIDARTPARPAAAFARLCGARFVLADRSGVADGVRWVRPAELDCEMPQLASAVPDDTAYVIATSGTTGAPKGVVVPDHAVAAYLGWSLPEYGVTAGYGAPLFTSLGFDLTVTSLFGPLTTGRRLVVYDAARWPLELARDRRSLADASFVKLTPSQLDILCLLLQDVDGQCRVPVLVVGGEPMYGQQVARWRVRFPAARIVNEYGPSEATVGCCRYVVPDGVSTGRVPIGTPPPGVTLTLRPLPDPGGEDREDREGGEGELVIAGEQVATGYLAEGRVHPFGQRHGTRCYPSGDHVGVDRDGVFTYLGRLGREAKVNGFRVNLAALEAQLTALPGVLGAAVRTTGDGLTAHVVVRDAATTEQDLRRRLRDHVPVYALPTTFVIGTDLVTTERGKLAATPVGGEP